VHVSVAPAGGAPRREALTMRAGAYERGLFA
jgi:hypothetical protein